MSLHPTPYTYTQILGVVITAYNQVKLDPDSRKYTAFICHRGLFEYNVLPMGTTNATETFQRLMNKLFEGILHKIVETYLDDIIIYSKTF